MALSVTSPSYAFTNRFPNIYVTGSAGKSLLFSVKLGGETLLEDETYIFNSIGMATIRFLGDLLEKHFYDNAYDVRNFMLSAVLTFKSEGETVEKTIPTYFLRSYVSTENLSPDAIRNRPLSRHTEKHTLPGVKEYVSFVSSSGASVAASITYLSGDNVLSKTVTLHSFGSSDLFTTIDVSEQVISGLLSAGEIPLEWSVYKSGYSGNRIKYILDKASSFPATVFLFQTCYGGIESFLCRGICKNEMQANREIASLGGRSIISKQTSARSYSVNTGYLDPEKQESLIDLLNCRNLMVLKGNTAVPAIINGENVSMHNFRSKLPTAEFTYSHTERNLTEASFNESEGVFDYTFDNTFN